MTLNGVMALILHYFGEFVSLKRHVGLQKLFANELTASSKFCSRL